MKEIRTLLLSGVIVFAITAFGQDTKSAADRGVPAKATSGGAPGTMFHDCPDCPEMVVIPAGNFIMGSSASEKSWAATHGASAESVSDESPQHPVSLRSFALGKYAGTRGQYAARAGTSTWFWWDDDDGKAADFAWYKSNSGGQTHPVGSKSANAFGLYDMVGNVWQWTQDCYAETYANAPKDGSASKAATDCL